MIYIVMKLQGSGLKEKYCVDRCKMKFLISSSSFPCFDSEKLDNVLFYSNELSLSVKFFVLSGASVVCCVFKSCFGDLLYQKLYLSREVIAILVFFPSFKVALAWGIKRGISVLPKSVSGNHIKENLEALHVKLDDDDMKAIGSIGVRHRYLNMHWPYTNNKLEVPKDLWDGEE